jgi:hypothetical protein
MSRRINTRKENGCERNVEEIANKKTSKNEKEQSGAKGSADE